VRIIKLLGAKTLRIEVNNINFQEVALKFMSGRYTNDLPSHIWKEAINHILKHFNEYEFDSDKLHLMWISYGGHIRRHVADDLVILKFLRKVLPPYEGQGMTLYRGECRFLYEKNNIGFCWTPHQKVAEMFASGLNSIESGGVLLEAYVPSEAILSEPNDHSKNWLGESEFTCDPTLIYDVKLLKSYPKFK